MCYTRHASQIRSINGGTSSRVLSRQNISVGSCSVKPSYEVSAVERIIRRKCGRLYGSATTHSPPPTGRHLAAEQPHPGAVPGATVQPDCWSHWTGILPEGVEAACTALPAPGVQVIETARPGSHTHPYR